LCLGAILAAAGCGGDIWNASDLAEWVRDRAVEEGCRRETILLEEWYRDEASGNVWHGTCENAGTGDDMSFAINVDSVWTPSQTNSR
jgi:hypothetical protein